MKQKQVRKRFKIEEKINRGKHSDVFIVQTLIFFLLLSKEKKKYVMEKIGHYMK